MSFNAKINELDIEFRFAVKGENYDKYLRQLMHDRSIFDGNLGKIMGFLCRHILPNNLVLECYNFILTDTEGRLSWILLNGDDAIGLLTLKKLETHESVALEEGKNYYRIDFSLIKKYQNQGICTSLADILKVSLAYLDINYVIFDIPHDNTISQHIVQNLGASHVCTVKDVIKFDIFMLKL